MQKIFQNIGICAWEYLCINFITDFQLALAYLPLDLHEKQLLQQNL